MSSASAYERDMDDKAMVSHEEDSHSDKHHGHALADAVARGQPATDHLGNALVEIDRNAVTKLRRKIDLAILPTVFFLYLFCFIDRANIGAKYSVFSHCLHLPSLNATYDYV